MIRKTGNIFGSIYTALFIIYLLIGFFPLISQGIMLIFLLISYFFVILSIRFLFLLEIRIASIIGIITCIASEIGYIILPEFFLQYSNVPNKAQIIISSMIVIFLMLIFNLGILLLSFRPNIKEEAIVKRKIIEYGKKIERIKIKDISDKSNVDASTVFRTLTEMIKNQEIYAAYFKSSKTIAFNQIANLENIDSLMKLYEDWEHQRLKKV